MNISQSMLKMYQKYIAGDECGLLFKAKYITNTLPDSESTDAQAAGQWFEFICTGATPRNSGVIPQPVRTAKGELTAMYKNLESHYHTWLTIRPPDAQYGVVISNDTAIFGHVLTGITDVLTPALIGDIKTTAFIDNKWEEYGWGGEPEYIAQRPTMFQSKYYILINWLNTGKILPFWFYVFASNSAKCKQILVNMSESAVSSFLKEVEYLVHAIEDEAGQFRPVPSFDRCKDCPIPCPSKQTTPDIIEINY